MKVFEGVLFIFYLLLDLLSGHFHPNIIKKIPIKIIFLSE